MGAPTQRTRPDGTPAPPFGRIDWFFRPGPRLQRPRRHSGRRDGGRRDLRPRGARPSPSRLDWERAMTLPAARREGRLRPCLRPPRQLHRGARRTPCRAEASTRERRHVGEIDVMLTADGELVLMHDDILDRTTNGKGRVADRTARRSPSRRRVRGSILRFAGTRVPTLRRPSTSAATSVWRCTSRSRNGSAPTS